MKEILENCNWTDLSIIKQADNSILFVLFFKSQENVLNFMQLLSKNTFHFTIHKNGSTYSFSIEFEGTEYGIRYDSKYTDDNYPPVTWLRDRTPSYITCGEYRGNRELMYIPNAILIDNLLTRYSDN